MRARSLTAWIDRMHPDLVCVRQWQALEESSALDRFGVCFYNAIQRHLPRAHHLYFNFLEVASLHRRSLRTSVRRRFCQLLEEFKPDVIVSVHAHLNHAYFSVAKELSRGRIRCLTYCGELSGGYGFSRHWVNPAGDGFIAAVEECAQAAHSLGMPAERTSVGGFLLQPPFFSPSMEVSAELRDRLWGDQAKRPVILLGTGANGANQHLPVLEALSALGLELTVVALCGRNETTRSRIIALQRKWPTLNVIPLAYRTDMADILRAVDLAFIRPGTGTTSECILSRCPVLFNGIGGVMPQEHITVRFMRGRGYPAQVASSPRACANFIKESFGKGVAEPFLQEKKVLESINRGLRPDTIVGAVLV